MNDEAHQDSLASRPAAGSPGAAIREARSRAGMSIDELGARTRLSRATLEAMESDAFDRLLEPVYVRGYYRKCARILDIDEEPLIRAYDALYTPPPKPAQTRVRLASGGELGSAPRLSLRFALLAPLIGVVVVVVLWMARTPPAPTSVPAPTVTLIDPTLTGEGALPPPEEPTFPGAMPEPATDTAVVEAPSVDEAQPPAAEGAADAAPAPTVDAAAPEAAPAQPAGTQLVLDFNAISWARVEDASGKSLVSGVISEGEHLTLDGKPPYSVFLGNAPGVSVQFGGVAFDVKPFTRSNSTARFSVPAAGG